MNKLKALKSYFGHTSFRDGQEELIDALLSGRDAMGIMPTGAGKSICYQLPAVLMEGVTIVVSPLISLMKDQVNALNQMGIPAAYLNSSLTERQFAIALSRAYNGAYKIIYVAPERLETDGFMRLAQSIKISMLTIDEAHCISQWGQDFRPSYLKIKDFINGLAYRPVIGAFTATATARVKKDILELLKLENPITVTTGFDRQNLYFGVEHPRDKNRALYRILKRNKGKSGIIYCTSRKNVEAVCSMLCEAGFAATRYHAGLDDAERIINQEDFLYDRKNVMVATNAFGMGIDKSNVSFVVHYNMPKDIESYYQEAGRAGRDGSEAECIMLYSKRDVHTIRWFIDNSEPNELLTDEMREEIKKRDEERLRQMVFYCTTSRCLRQFILDYFGDSRKCECNKCSGCCPENQEEAREVKASKQKHREMVWGDFDGFTTVDEYRPIPVRNKTVLTGEEEALFDALKRVRSEKAKTAGVPAFVIFSDATLRDMCRIKPLNKEEFMSVSGVGDVKAKKYSAAFIAEIKRFMSSKGLHTVHEATVQSEVKPKKKPERKEKEYELVKPWDEHETAKLRRELLMGKSIGELAKLHGRDPMEISAKLREFK